MNLFDDVPLLLLFAAIDSAYRGADLTNWTGRR